jgi:hypothetical protein
MKAKLQFLLLWGVLLWPGQVFGQVVNVTLSLDKQQINVGETTTLHVFAQIVPAQRGSTDRIFSWYVDLLDLNGSVAKLQTGDLAKPSSDKNPALALPGTVEGDNLRGILDTFMNLPGAGRDSAVELISIPVKATAAGKAILKIQAGSSVPGLAEDFIVAPTGGGDPLTGGDYSAAQIDVQVSANIEQPRITVLLGQNPQTHAPEITIKFTPIAGTNYFVEATDNLGPNASWQALPGAPHNSGQITDSASAPHRFYRVRAQ